MTETSERRKTYKVSPTFTSSLPWANFLTTAQVGGVQEESSSPGELRKQRSEFGALKQMELMGLAVREEGVMGVGRAKVYVGMYSFARAAVTKYHKLGGLNIEIYSLAALEAGSPKSRCQQSWFLLRENLLSASPLASGGLLSIFDIPGL